MKQNLLFLSFFTIGVLFISGCGKDAKKDIPLNNYVPSTTSPTILETTTPENALKVYLNNLTYEAGSDIDYLSAIESAENMELDKSMVYVNSAEVNRFKPGDYPVYYTFDYMGQKTSGKILVTIKESSTTQPPSEPVIQDTPPATQEITSDTTRTEQPSQTDEGNSETNVSSVETTENIPSDSTGEIQVTLPSNQPLPDAVITLSTGETVSIPCTSDYYIVETYTEDSYSSQNGYTYLTSTLKVLMNNGDVQVLETVMTRVSNTPETTAP